MEPEETSAFLDACRLSPDLFIEFVGNHDQAQLHHEFQQHLTKHDENYSELPRGHGKTTQITYRCAWEIGNDPDLRIKYLMQNAKEAKKTGELVKSILDHPRYRMVFPWVQPDPNHWGKESLRVMQSQVSRDPTIEFVPIGGRAGGRFDLLVADDICDWANSVSQPTMREKIKDAWGATWLPMGDETRPKPPRIWKVGTPYHVSDITADWRHQHEQDGSLFRRPVVNYVSPWSEVWTPDKLHKKKASMSSIAYARAYELLPVSSELLVFPAEWLQSSFYEDIPDWESKNGRMIATFDFAFSDRKQKQDPDYSVCLIGWQTNNGHVYVIDMLRKQATFPDFVDKALELCSTCNVAYGKAEGNGPQKGLVQALDRQSSFPVIPIERGRDKFTRASEVQPLVQSGRFHIRAARDSVGVLRPVRKLDCLYEEMTTFPASDHDDTVDTAIDMMNMISEKTSPLRPNPINANPDRITIYN